MPIPAFHRLLRAIVDDDLPTARHLLKAEPFLVMSQTDHPTLYKTKILHWLYAGDTALHIAAAGHRVALVRLLLAMEADPNAAGNHRRSRPLHYAADGQPSYPSFDARQQVQTI